MAVFTSRPIRIIRTDRELRDALHFGTPGEVATWHRGDLARDRVRDPELDRLARAVAEAERKAVVRAFVIHLAPGVSVHRLRLLRCSTRAGVPLREIARGRDRRSEC